MTPQESEEWKALCELVDFIMLHVPKGKQHTLAKIINRYVKARVRRHIERVRR